MKVTSVLMVIASLVVLVGCVGGPRVVDNQYQVIGMPPFTISDDFTYVGSPDLKDNGRCVGADCRTFATPGGGRVTGDIFVKAIDGEVKEFIVIQRSQTGSGYYWIALKGDQYRFGGKDYIERFTTINGATEKGSYVTLLKEAGYTHDGGELGLLSLQRNVSDQNRLYVAYGCSDNLVPDEIDGNAEAEKEFLRQGLLKNLTLPE